MTLWVLMLMLASPPPAPDATTPAPRPVFKVVYLGPYRSQRTCVETAQNMEKNGTIRGIWDCRPADSDELAPSSNGDRS